MAALPAALIRLLPFLAAFNLAERIFRAFARALISFRRWAGDSLRLAGGGDSWLEGDGISPPAMESISAWRDSICSFRAIIWVSWVVVNSVMFMGDF